MVLSKFQTTATDEKVRRTDTHTPTGRKERGSDPVERRLQCDILFRHRRRRRLFVADRSFVGLAGVINRAEQRRRGEARGALTFWGFPPLGPTFHVTLE